MKNIILVLALFILLLPSNAQSMQPMSKTKEECQEIWNTIWPKVESGDPVARLQLFFNMQFGGFKSLPGHFDALATLRNLKILAVHSIGLMETRDEFFEDEDTEKDKAEDIKYVNEMLNTFYYKHREGFPGDHEFFKCIETNRSPECAQILVEHRVVPSFEEYVDEINAFMAVGKIPICPFYPALFSLQLENENPQKNK